MPATSAGSGWNGWSTRHPFYTSVDIRNAGFKLAPVDTNLFPGGWNNLTPEMLPLAVQAAMAAIEKICPEARNLLIIPENHTRNSFYLSNLVQLQRIFNMAGLNVRIGSVSPEIKKRHRGGTAHGRNHHAGARGAHASRRLGLKDFDPCTILLNNDLSAGCPASWKTCTSSTCCRRCTQAGRCGARAATSTLKKWPSALASCWALTPG
jgi:glutamate--cysteine ligase